MRWCNSFTAERPMLRSVALEAEKETELLCRNPSNLAVTLPRNMVCENEQIAAVRSAGRL